MPVYYLTLSVAFTSKFLETYADVQNRLEDIKEAIATSLDISPNAIDIEIDESAGKPEGGWPESEGVNLEPTIPTMHDKE